MAHPDAAGMGTQRLAGDVELLPVAHVVEPDGSQESTALAGGSRDAVRSGAHFCWVHLTCREGDSLCSHRRAATDAVLKEMR